MSNLRWVRRRIIIIEMDTSFSWSVFIQEASVTSLQHILHPKTMAYRLKNSRYALECLLRYDVVYRLIIQGRNKKFAAINSRSGAMPIKRATRTIKSSLELKNYMRVAQLFD